MWLRSVCRFPVGQIQPASKGSSVPGALGCSRSQVLRDCARILPAYQRRRGSSAQTKHPELPCGRCALASLRSELRLSFAPLKADLDNQDLLIALLKNFVVFVTRGKSRNNRVDVT